MKTLSIGIQNFKKLREKDCLYVDKTGILQGLIENGSQYFLSRPRRFGKSLTLSTLEAMFKGEAELFKGLNAEEWVKAAKPAFVLRLDMSRTITNSGHNLVKSLKEMLSRFARKHGVALYSESVDGMLADLIEGIFEAYSSFVLLIDEYDKPILDNITNLRRANEMREVLRSFYTIVKSYDECFCFVFITGISKFSKTGVFSVMNNLVDISMLRRYGDITGYTQKELEEKFSDWITSKSMSLGKDELLKAIKNYYDGFSFDGTTRLYNPFSILNFLFDEKFGNYWYTSGSPSFIVFIVKYMKEHRIQSPDEYRHMEVPLDFADSHEIETSKPESFLYQSGYLTIEKLENDVITLDYPNEEVKKSLA